MVGATNWVRFMWRESDGETGVQVVRMNLCPNVGEQVALESYDFRSG